MVRCGNLLSPLPGLVPRVGFAGIVRKHQAERACKGFSCWGAFVAILFCQLGQAHSLREIVGGLGSMPGKARHAGRKETPRRSILSYVNAHRPWEVYRDTFYALLHRGRGLLAGRLKRPLRFKNALHTPIWTALIAILMRKTLELRSRLGWSLSTLAALLRWDLFSHRDLWEWVDNPFGPPPQEDPFEQPSLFDSALGRHPTHPKGGTSS